MKCSICGEEGHNKLNKKHKRKARTSILPPSFTFIIAGLGMHVIDEFIRLQLDSNKEKARKYDAIVEVIEDDE